MWLESKSRLGTEFDIRLHPIDFELLHYSAGVFFASWADGNIIRIETVQDTFVASFSGICFLSTAKQLLKKCLKCLKRLEVLLGTFRESKETDRSLICHEISPSMYVRNMRGVKSIENIFERDPNGPHTRAWTGE